MPAPPPVIRAEAVEAAIQATGEAPALEISAQRSEWDLQSHQVRFEGEVLATRGPLELRCHSLLVRFGEGERVEEARATGQVRIRQGDRQARGEEALLQAETGRLELTGQPELQEGPHRMTGERIVFWLDQERVECERCRVTVAGEALAPR